MALNIQYNKTALQQIEKQLKVRLNALPTLKSKEAALRVEVKKAKQRFEELDELLKEKMNSQTNSIVLWSEFEKGLLTVKSIDFNTKKIAGVETPLINDVYFDIKDFSLFNKPTWFYDGIQVLKEFIKIAVERDFFEIKTKVLEYARKKTTQKVNLYEKVQIPEFDDAIRKIKRFLEDKDNLSKAAQKIVKNKKAKAEGIR